MHARASCLRLFEHFMRAAAARTFCTAGSSSPIRMAMMAITTSSSISVNALNRRDERRIAHLQGEEERKKEQHRMRSGESARGGLAVPGDQPGVPSRLQ